MQKTILFLFLFTSYFLFAQSPWTQKKGKFYTQFSFSSVPSYNTVYGKPDYTVSGTISDNTLQFYGEYGVSDKTTIMVTIPYKIISRKNFDPLVICITTPCGGVIDKKIKSLGNIEIGIKHNFSSKKWLLSGQLSVEMITNSSSSFDDFSGISTGYNAWTYTPLFIIGKSSEKRYLQLFTGFNFRTNNFSDNFKIGGEIGWKVSKKLWLATFLDIVKSFYNGTIDLGYSNNATALYVNNQEFGGFGFKGIYEFSTSFGATAGLGGAFFANNVAKQVALNVGIYKRF